MSDTDGLGGEERATVERVQDLDRVVFFSDAVFAIAMTVLALSLAIPAHTTDSGVAHALRKEVPSIFTYVLSFAVIGLNWIAHHRMFRYIRRLDATLLVLNLALLCVVAFVPFPTAVLAAHGNSTAAVVFYAGTMALLGGAHVRVLGVTPPRSTVDRGGHLRRSSSTRCGALRRCRSCS